MGAKGLGRGNRPLKVHSGMPVYNEEKLRWAKRLDGVIRPLLSRGTASSLNGREPCTVLVGEFLLLSSGDAYGMRWSAASPCKIFKGCSISVDDNEPGLVLR